jgi:diguanylate cyclase (GGDEF)-like protein
MHAIGRPADTRRWAILGQSSRAKMSDSPVPPSAPVGTRAGARPFVLIADADQRRAAIYGDLIESRGLRAIVTRNGDEAKATLQRRELPVLLVVNLSLPRLDGFTLLAELRRTTGASGPPALIIASTKELGAAASNLRERLGVTEIVAADATTDQIRDVLGRLLPGMGPDHPESHAAPPFAQDLGSRWVTETLDRFAEEAARRFDVRITLVSVTIADHEFFRMHLNPAPKALPGRESPGSWSLIRQVTEYNQPLVVPDLRQHPVFSFEAFPPAGTLRGYAGVPIRVEQGTVSGALCLLDTEPLTLDARAIDALSDAAHRLALELETGVERVRDQERYTALTRLALTDPITGLANRRGGEAALAREVSRARRGNAPLSLVMFDIDHFKSVNDRSGHPVGDRVLGAISQLLSSSQRGSDLAIRWGGEEFLVLLPDVGHVGAHTFAERVRENVQSLTIGEAGTITISAGVAELRRDEDGASALARADASLYRAKQEGRNRVVCDDDTERSEPAWLPAQP